MTDVLWYGVVRRAVRPSARLQELCGLGCSNLVCTLYMERGRSLFIFKVKGEISKSLGLYKELWNLDPCGQDIARTIQSRLLKCSMYTSYENRKKSIYFQGQISRSLGLYKDIWHLDPCGQDIARTLGC